MSTDRTLSSKTDCYTLEEPLGVGGQGRTWIARRERDGLRCVVKELHLQLAADWKSVEHFEREVLALRSLDHPAIPAYLDHTTDEDGRVSALVQEFAAGETLEELIAGAPLPPGRFVEILASLLDVISYLHRRVPPLLHRDIQPRNVIAGPSGVRLVDFGVARWGRASSATAVGTFGYVAPEQLLGRAERASDLYGAGMTMLALANRVDASEFPIDRGTGQVDVSQLLTSVPDEARRTLYLLTRPGLDERCESARDAKAVLARGAAVPAVRLSSRSGSNAAGSLAALCVAVALVLAVAGFFFVESEEPLPAEQIESHGEPVEQVFVHQPAREPEVDRRPNHPTPTRVAAAGGATLTVESSPAGAEVYHLDEKLCVTPCALEVAYGLIRLEFRLGDRSLAREVRVNDDMTLSVAF